jgi:hypothetical protein
MLHEWNLIEVVFVIATIEDFWVHQMDVKITIFK